MSNERTYDLAGKTVSRVGFGAMQLHWPSAREVPPAAVAETILRDAYEGGANQVDTAAFYGGGEVNRLIRAALAPYPEDLFLATKIGAAETPAGGLVPAQKPAELRAQVEENLAGLGVEALDLVYMRRVDRAPGIVAEGDQVVDLDHQLAELAALREEGKLRAIGLSHVSAAQVEAALPVGIAAVQNLYGLLNREDEPTLELCATSGVAWVPFFPLGSGFGDRRKVVDEPLVREIAAELDATPAQVGLAWLLDRDPHVLLIPATANPEHLRENLAAGYLELPADAVTRLDAVG
jgi:aryl-alcohol dehydrogenase-like predicted oxidoreductase